MGHEGGRGGGGGLRGERRQTAVRHKAHNDDEGTKRAAGQESGGTAGPGRRNRMETMHVMCTKGVGASGAEGGRAKRNS